MPMQQAYGDDHQHFTASKYTVPQIYLTLLTKILEWNFVQLEVYAGFRVKTKPF